MFFSERNRTKTLMEVDSIIKSGGSSSSIEDYRQEDRNVKLKIHPAKCGLSIAF